MEASAVSPSSERSANGLDGLCGGSVQSYGVDPRPRERETRAKGILLSSHGSSWIPGGVWLLFDDVFGCKILPADLFLVSDGDDIWWFGRHRRTH